jgi:tRNA (guanine-N7-)-methyltransferase
MVLTMASDMKDPGSQKPGSKTIDFSAPRFYGRRKGRPLRHGMQTLLATKLPAMRFDLDQPVAEQFSAPCDDIFLEIGFGGGEHIAGLARQRPDAGFIGAEPFINGVASLLRHIQDDAIENIRIWDDDVRLIFTTLEDASLAGAYVMFPDPWPKKRHAGRRILQADVMDSLARLIRPGGSLVMASDDPTAKSWLLQAAMRHPAFDWTARCADDWQSRPAYLPATRYMKKAENEARRPAWFVFTRNEYNRC